MSSTLLAQLSEGLRERLQQTPDPVAAEALAIAETSGLPEARTESWRYSSLRLMQRALRPTEASPLNSAPLDFVCAQPGSDDAPDWVVAGAAKLGDERRSPDQAFAWLARAAGCEQLTLTRNQIQPLYFDPLAGLSRELPHRHRQVIVEAGAEITVVEHYRDGEHGNFANLLQEIAVGAGATLRWIRLVEAHSDSHLIVRSEFDLAAGAKLIHHNLELSSAWSRQDLRVRLGGEEAELISHGLLPLAGKRHADTQLEVIHAFGNSRSQMRWRGVAAERARAVFNGRILIEAGADGSDAALNTSSLLLSPHAEIDAKPELEIYADAVKAAHGAAIGQLDPAALFYMRSRGLPEAQARQLLMASFCRHALDDLSPELLTAVEARVDHAIAALHRGNA